MAEPELASQDEGRCTYTPPGKKRTCRVFRYPGRLFCADHLIHDPSPGKFIEGKDISRVPCPYSDTHTVFVSQLARHLKKCNFRPPDPSAIPPYHVTDVNLPDETESVWLTREETVTADAGEEVVERVRRKVEVAYRKLNLEIPIEILDHPVLRKRMDELGDGSLKHAKQQASIAGQMHKLDLLTDGYDFCELGCGRAELSRYLSLCIPRNPVTRFFLIDRSASRRNHDVYLREGRGVSSGRLARPRSSQEHIPTPSANPISSEIAPLDLGGPRQVKRCKMDIKDLYLSRLVEEVGETHQLEARGEAKPLVCYSKHLCGEATDLALRALKSSLRDRPGSVHSVLIALCCHHRISSRTYVNNRFLRDEIGIESEEEFEGMKSITGWASSGDGGKGTNDDEELIEIEERAVVGFMAKRLFDYGRLLFTRALSGSGGGSFKEESRLLKYVGEEVTPENVLLVGRFGRVP